MAADYTSTGTVSTMGGSFPAWTLIEATTVVITNAPVVDMSIGGGGGGGSTRPTTGFLYPRGQG